MLDYVYSSLHFYNAAEWRCDKEQNPVGARQLLRETGQLLTSSIPLMIGKGLELWKTLMQFMVAVCLGRAFFINCYVLEAQKCHRAVSHSLQKGGSPSPEQLQLMVTDSHDAYRSIDYLRAANLGSKGLLQFPMDVFTQPYKPIELLIDDLVLKISQCDGIEPKQ